MQRFEKTPKPCHRLAPIFRSAEGYFTGICHEAFRGESRPCSKKWNRNGNDFEVLLDGTLLGTWSLSPADRSLVHTSETIDRKSTIGMAQKRTSTCVNTDPRRAISPARYDGFIGRLLLVVGQTSCLGI